VLDCLIADRRISASDVSRYVSDMHREISDLESRLQNLRASAGDERLASARLADTLRGELKALYAQQPLAKIVGAERGGLSAA